MKVGIIGAGTVGTTLGEHIAAAGHEVLITNSRGPESLSEGLATTSQPIEPVPSALYSNGPRHVSWRCHGEISVTSFAAI